MNYTIIGSGPSMSHLDTRLLRNRKCCGINLAYLLGMQTVYGSVKSKEFEALCSIGWHGTLIVKDVRVIEKIRKDPRWLAWNASEGNQTVFATQSDAQVYDGMESAQLRIGDTTAISAIDWAVKDGAESLTLVGFDGGFREGKRHFHDGEYPTEWEQEESTYDKHYEEIWEYIGTEQGGTAMSLPRDLNPRYVTFATPEYREQVEALCKSFAEVLPPHRMMLIDRPTMGTWVANAAMKAKVIRGQLDDAWPRPVVWLDADARVRKNPDELLAQLPWQDIDIAFHRRKSTHRRYDGELLTGTLYFGNTVEARLVLDLWIREIEANPGTWDQKLLDKVMQSTQIRVMEPKVCELPGEYCCMDLICQHDGIDEESAVVWHTQASRRLRRIVDEGSK